MQTKPQPLTAEEERVLAILRKLLRKAADQLKQATVDAETGGLFVVIHVVGCETDWAWLVEGTDLRGPYTLEEFRERWLVEALGNYVTDREEDGTPD